jgi:hypothetical protein
VGEVFIPAKVDKQGKRFGFVKYRDVQDAKELLRSISNIWIDSFKIRINLSKFSKQYDHGEGKRVETIAAKPGNSGDGKTTQGRSFKSALVDDDAGRRKTWGVVTPVGVPEVVWEVEVEEERLRKLEGAYVGYLVENRDIHSIQNNLRMDGYNGVNVTAMGHLMVLMWSERVGEVKEVVETVGWWCSLFEKVIPWSPELVSNQRVAWLSCYGVPLHAWGMDLFRALAFKFGRFIETDEPTLMFKRCDVAKIKILTSQKQLIDSSMAVKVLGKKFEIRVMEEVGGGEQHGGRGVLRGVEVWQEDEVSRASGDGASFQAVVEGFSETGSDADVSESCQVLLGLEKHGGNQTTTTGSIKAIEFATAEQADFAPNNLGNFIGVSGELVNSDGDKGEDIVVESAELVGRVEGVQTGGVGGTHVDEVSNEEGREDQGECGEVGRVGLGSAQENFNRVPVTNVTNVEEGCLEQFGNKDKPKVLRTRKGDLVIIGPSNTVSDCQVQAAVKKIKSRAEKHSTHRKNSNNNTNPIPPSNKFQKFADVIPPQNRPGRRKKVGRQHQAKSTGEQQSASDSIHNSEDTQPLIPRCTSNVPQEFQLEVVLTGETIVAATMESELAVQPAHHEGSGLATLLGQEEDAGQINRDSGVEIPNRQQEEAMKILAIQKTVGVTVQESEDDHVNRMVVMEARDKAEKVDWEMNRVTTVSQ